MKTLVLSYSFTGNNELLAKEISTKLNVAHLQITESILRTNKTIFTDALFNKTPVVNPKPETLLEYDRIIFVGPVWMGQPAFPFRSFFKFLKSHPKNYAYICVSGGSLNNNPGLEKALTKKIKTKPELVLDFHIADLIQSNDKVTPKQTESYKLTEKDIEMMSDKAVEQLKDLKN